MCGLGSLVSGRRDFEFYCLLGMMQVKQDDAMMIALGVLPKMVYNSWHTLHLATVSAHCSDIKVLLFSSVLRTVEKSGFYFLTQSPH